MLAVTLNMLPECARSGAVFHALNGVGVQNSPQDVIEAQMFPND